MILNVTLFIYLIQMRFLNSHMVGWSFVSLQSIFVLYVCNDNITFLGNSGILCEAFIKDSCKFTGYGGILQVLRPDWNTSCEE